MRYGSTSSRFSGPPYAMSSTGMRSAAMHHLHHGLQRLDRSVGQDAVSEIEDVAGPAARAAEDVTHPRLERRAWREQSDGIEVALDRARGTDALPRRIERNTPVDADHVTPRGRKVLEESGGVGSEMDNGHPGPAREFQGAPAVRLHVGAVVLRGQTADPAVEQLERSRSGIGLRGEIAPDQLREALHQGSPGARPRARSSGLARARSSAAGRPAPRLG